MARATSATWWARSTCAPSTGAREPSAPHTECDDAATVAAKTTNGAKAIAASRRSRAVCAAADETSEAATATQNAAPDYPVDGQPLVEGQWLLDNAPGEVSVSTSGSASDATQPGQTSPASSPATASPRTRSAPAPSRPE